MIYSTGKFALDYLLQSKYLKADRKHLWGIPYSGVSPWRSDMVMEKLVAAGLAKEKQRSVKDGKLMEIWMPKPITIQQMEDVCLSEKDKARIDAWLKKGVMR